MLEAFHALVIPAVWIVGSVAVLLASFVIISTAAGMVAND